VVNLEGKIAWGIWEVIWFFLRWTNRTKKNSSISKTGWASGNCLLLKLWNARKCCWSKQFYDMFEVQKRARTRPKAKIVQLRASTEGPKRNHPKVGELRRAQSETNPNVNKCRRPKAKSILKRASADDLYWPSKNFTSLTTLKEKF